MHHIKLKLINRLPAYQEIKKLPHVKHFLCLVLQHGLTFNVLAHSSSLLDTNFACNWFFSPKFLSVGWYRNHTHTHISVIKAFNTWNNCAYNSLVNDMSGHLRVYNWPAAHTLTLHTVRFQG